METVLPVDLTRELRCGRFALVVDEYGKWRVYKIKRYNPKSCLVEVDLSYQGTGTTQWRLHHGRTTEPFQLINGMMIRGVYDDPEEVVAITQNIENERLLLEAARERFWVSVSMFTNIPL